MAGTVPAAQLAALFDCDEKTIRNLASKGIVVKEGRGEYLLGQSIKNYVRHLREMAAGRMGSDDKIDPVRENALFKREQRRHYELKNALLEGSAVSVDRLEPAWALVIRTVRSAMLAVPGKARLRLPHLTNHDGDVIEQIVREQLEDASATDEPPRPRD